MSRPAPLATASVGVVVERRKAKSAWAEHTWRPVAALPGAPATPPWTELEGDDDSTRFYAGSAELGLYRADTSHYRDNLATGSPGLWVVLRPTGGEPPFAIAAVTANPSEGEAFTESGTDLVEPVPMPELVIALVDAFVDEHHVEHGFTKRKRNRADPDALARRGPLAQDDADRHAKNGQTNRQTDREP
jgi:hypothetical protein